VAFETDPDTASRTRLDTTAIAELIIVVGPPYTAENHVPESSHELATDTLNWRCEHPLQVL
jgi:hypothetical protein